MQRCKDGGKPSCFEVAKPAGVQQASSFRRLEVYAQLLEARAWGTCYLTAYIYINQQSRQLCL
jgi:hypothetical protein